MPPQSFKAERNQNTVADSTRQGALESTPIGIASLPVATSVTDIPMYRPMTEKTFRIGILTASLDSLSKHVFAISNPASLCVVGAVVLRDSTDDLSNVKDWCTRNCLGPVGKDVTVSSGEDGIRELFEGSGVDAIYIALPVQCRKDYVTRALQGRKHVLLDYPVESSLSGFATVLQTAREARRHIQDSTMFIHHHRVTQFLECVLDQPSFGRISHVYTTLNVSKSLLDKMTVQANPDWMRQGCVATLARYCIMFGVLVFSRLKSKPLSVQVTTVERDGNGSPVEAVCKVNFESGRSLIIDCSFTDSASTRQHVEIVGESRSASMINFVYPNHSLASYRISETNMKHGGKQHAVSGSSRDIQGGPPQAVMMWRRFAELSRSVDNDNRAMVAQGRTILDEAHEQTYVTAQSQNIINSLMKSIDQGGQEVMLDDVDLKMF